MKPITEEQLQFAFFTDSTPASVLPISPPPSRISKANRSLPSLTDMLTDAHTILLEASSSEVDAQLLPLFEFCEAALTRALDIVPARTGEVFSAEEQRSLRGIGQAQWLLSETRSKRTKKMKNE